MTTSYKDLETGRGNEWWAEPVDRGNPSVPQDGRGRTPTQGSAPAGGDSLATLVYEYIEQYVVLSREQLTAATLFVFHTWSFGAAQATPYLVVLSPLWQTGKTRLLEVLERIVSSPLRADDISGPALFRAIEEFRPTVLLDELDVLFGSRSERADALRNLLNAGNRASGLVHRCVPPAWEVKSFSVFGPKVLAGIDNGRWPDTLLDRAVILRTKRRRPDEEVRSFRFAEAEAEAAVLRGKLTRWGQQQLSELRDATPDMPQQLSDRACDAWEPLLAIADLIGGVWPKAARSTAIELHHRQEQLEDSPRLALLEDIRTVFRGLAQTKIGSVALCSELRDLAESRWSAWGAHRGKPGLQPNDLAMLLRPFGIRPRTVRLALYQQPSKTVAGYDRAWFEDAWVRYLPPVDETPAV